MIRFFVLFPGLYMLESPIKVFCDVFLDCILWFRKRRGTDHCGTLITCTWFHILHILSYQIDQSIDELRRNLRVLMQPMLTKWRNTYSLVLFVEIVDILVKYFDEQLYTGSSIHTSIGNLQCFL